MTWRRAPRAKGPSAPSAERAVVPCFRSLALPVGVWVPLRCGPDRAGGLGPREEPRTRSPWATSLHAWFRDGDDVAPEAPRLTMPRGVATTATGSSPWGVETLIERAFSSRHHRGAPSRALRPRRDSDRDSTPCGSVLGRDPSMEGVQPSCQRSAPGLRVDFPRSVSTELGWVSRFTPLHPLRPTARLPFRCSLPKRPTPDEPLALLVPPRRPALRHSRHGGSTPPSRAGRVNGRRERAGEEHLPPAKSARGRSCSRVAARAAVPFR
jgi:hypothetical protein